MSSTEKKKQLIAIVVAGLGITFCIGAILLNVFKKDKTDTVAARNKYNQSVESIKDNIPPTGDTNSTDKPTESAKTTENNKNNKDNDDKNSDNTKVNKANGYIDDNPYDNLSSSNFDTNSSNTSNNRTSPADKSSSIDNSTNNRSNTNNSSNKSNYNSSNSSNGSNSSNKANTSNSERETTVNVNSDKSSAKSSVSDGYTKRY